MITNLYGKISKCVDFFPYGTRSRFNDFRNPRSEFLIEFHYTYTLLCVDYNVPYASKMTGDIALEERSFLVDDD